MSNTVIARAAAPLRTATTFAVSLVVSVLASLALLIAYALLALLFNLGSIGLGVTAAITKVLCLAVIVGCIAASRLPGSGR
ncbi:hypothetical protein [Methylobacterium sp. ID0610]|uniref:hypothetical protein n=1 Tax=Methylobacterium carpenticola TaxID=3344827 RepID=UPI00369BF93B